MFMGTLLAAGIYLSVVYFGQKAVPNSDFPAFVRTGSNILHFRMPGSFKRVPVLGILQISMGQFMFTSPHPVLTGALVLNGILYTLSILLYYKIVRFFIEPTGSFCLSLLAAVNPWSLAMVVDPIAETSIVFFILLTLYLIIKRSWWCYLAAMLASMTRYECFGLIGIALLFDLFSRTSKRQKLTAMGIAFAASIPMILWLIGTKITTTDTKGHYFIHFLDVQHRNGFDLIKMLWMTAFSSLLQWPEYICATLLERPATQQAADAIRSHTRHFQSVWNVVTAVFFIAGVIGVFLKKQWRFLGVLLFWAGYVCIHMSQSVLIDRYTVPVIWLTLLTGAYGISFLADRVPKGILVAIGVIGGGAALLWIFQLWPAISKTIKISPASQSVVYVSLLLLVIGLAARQFIFRGQNVVSDVCLFIIIALMIVSNQFSVVRVVGLGLKHLEFKMLANWYVDHAQKGEKLVSAVPNVLSIYAPEHKKAFVHLNSLKADNPVKFVNKCYKRKITYVTWDSVGGRAVGGRYYKLWGFKNIAILSKPKDVGPYEFVTQIKVNDRQLINVFKLRQKE